MAFYFGYDRSLGERRDPSLDLLESHRELLQGISTLKAKATQGNVTSDDVLSAVVHLEKCLPLISKRVTDGIAPEIFAMHRPPGAQGLAQKVFDILELLEMILENLDIDDMLVAQLVSRQFRDTVDASVRLQRKLSLLPCDDHVFSLTLGAIEGLSGLYCTTSTTSTYAPYRTEPVDNEEVVVNLHFTTDLSRVGTKCRRMLVVQPPVKEMKAYTNCCNSRPGQGGPKVEAVVRNKDGVTVGDLLDTARRLKKRHLHCSNAPVHLHNPVHGRVDVETTFETVIKLHEDDPELVWRTAREEQSKQRVREAKEYRRSMRAFVREKRVAHANGTELPEPAEWRTTYAPSEGLGGGDDSSDEE